MAKLTLKRLEETGALNLKDYTKAGLILLVQERYAQLKESLKAEEDIHKLNSSLLRDRNDDKLTISDLQFRIKSMQSNLDIQKALVKINISELKASNARNEQLEGYYSDADIKNVTLEKAIKSLSQVIIDIV